MALITISRQMGSLGCRVAALVSVRLGYRMVWRELINQAAQRCGAPEMALAAIDELGLLGVHPSKTARLAYIQAVERVMDELAVEGDVVIVGRASQAILHDREGAFHVRIIAPDDVRAERVALSKRVSRDAARALVTASDRSRRNFLRLNYHAHWDDPALYHLVVNTGRYSAASAAELICRAFEEFLHPSQPESESILSCE